MITSLWVYQGALHSSFVCWTQCVCTLNCFLFISRLKVMYKQRSSQSYDLDQGKGVTLFTSLQCHQDFMSRIESQCTTPTLLDYSFLSNIIEVGNVIKYQMRADASQISTQQCITRATVTSIRLNERDRSTPVLNNEDTSIRALYVVCRISICNMYSNDAMWNPT